MSRSNSFLAIGSLWSVTAFLFLGENLLPTSVLQNEGGPLAASLIVTAAIFFAVAMSDSKDIRKASIQTHLLLPLPFFWAWKMIDSSGIQLERQGALVLTLCAVTVAAMYERGVQLIELSQLNITNRASAKERSMATEPEKPAWKSGVFVRPTLAACDSGGFFRPTL